MRNVLCIFSSCFQRPGGIKLKRVPNFMVESATVSTCSSLLLSHREACASPSLSSIEINQSIAVHFFQCTPLAHTAHINLVTAGEGNVQILHPYGPDKLAGSMEIVPGVSHGRPLSRSNNVSLAPI